MDLTGGESKVQFCKEDYYIGPWNVRPMNQGILDMVKQGDGKIKHQYLFFFLFFFFLFVVNFIIHWNKTAMGLHVLNEHQELNEH